MEDDSKKRLCYTPELGKKICEIISSSCKSVRKICEENPGEFPHCSTVFDWLIIHSDFADQYARAKEEQADFMAEEIIDISDDGSRDYMKRDGVYVPDHDHIARSRLRVDSRKWLASKLRPKKYGDKVDVTSGGDQLRTFTLAMGDREINDDDDSESRPEATAVQIRPPETI